MRAWFAGAVTAYVIVWVYAALVLPDVVPLHFGFTGEADRFASRTEALVVFGAVGLGVALLFAGIDAQAGPRGVAPMRWSPVDRWP